MSVSEVYVKPVRGELSRWSADDAVDYLVRLTGVSRSKAELDVRRIVTFPGRAAAPHYGHLKLDMLRRLAQSTIGIVILHIYSTALHAFLLAPLYRAMHFSAKRGLGITISSVRLSVTLWIVITSKIISPLVSLGCSFSADPNIMWNTKGNTLNFGPK